MPAIDSFITEALARFGFVKLSRYGLVLTPEGRIMSLRPAVLNDGLGGRIVGWSDSDLAAVELQPWEPARPAPAPAVATPLAIPAPVAVAPAPQVEEDDWEWEIALARARVAAEESEKAASSVTRRARLDTIPPPSTSKLAVVKIPDKPEPVTPVTPVTVIAEAPPAPKQTQPLAAVALPALVKPVTAKPVAVSMPTPVPARPGTVPPTVIPIPKLPSIKERQSQIQPVVSAARTRLAKGTGPVSGTHVGPAPAPARTTQPQATALPAAARAITLPRLPRL